LPWSPLERQLQNLNRQMRFTYVLIFSLLGNVGALTGAGVLLMFPKLHDRLKTILLAYAVGTLLSAAFMGLIPEAIEHHQAERVLLVILAGLFGFFFLEKILRLPHIHGHVAEQHDYTGERHTIHPAGFLILVGDAFHNFVDGIVIATAFSVSVQLGVLTSRRSRARSASGVGRFHYPTSERLERPERRIG